MTTKVVTPFLGTNDTQAILLRWKVRQGERVEVGGELCEIETTKATIEVQSDAAGYFFPLVGIGETIEVTQILGFISATPDFDAKAYMESTAAVASEGPRITKKAELLIRRYKLNQSAVEAFADGARITEELVSAFISRQQIGGFARVGVGAGRKVAIIGGVGGGGALIVADTIARIGDMQAVAIYDRAAEFHGKSVLGVPIVGTTDKLEGDLKAGYVDAVVIAFNRNLEERHRIFEELAGRGVPFTNVIDPSADIRSGVEIGIGNIILGHVYVGACSRIEDNNFISANVALEHGNVLGSSCAFGPGVFTSGNVTIGNRVRFGTGVFVEPGINVGNDSIVGSGQTLVTNIREGAVLTSRAKA
ncbi:conserved hypothetical protein [uncultured Pleomorphomonas sp.]|uniref:Lipoyl-binding domain-containing protein n=1 Tax=uncultured Pleomorphomonas sp. TaxID=442121 RepID=A0A212LP11_9HYPH|nr:biotin/lipoyl-containing protein [uncultured Pleomorphomonas sp.]SCM79293.1 conserved hypothetical protein [uncultured Pleomorphomonas sp.]